MDNMIRVSMGGTVTRQFPLQSIATVDTLRNIYMPGHPAFHQSVIDAYNRYTEEINRETWHATREFLLDQRHRFFVRSMLDQKAGHEHANT